MSTQAHHYTIVVETRNAIMHILEVIFLRSLVTFVGQTFL